ncbi:MAG: hypothetical protein ACJAXH_001355 [Colwellia sp.]|jgi:hypothetical protein
MALKLAVVISGIQIEFGHYFLATCKKVSFNAQQLPISSKTA